MIYSEFLVKNFLSVWISYFTYQKKYFVLKYCLKVQCVKTFNIILKYYYPFSGATFAIFIFINV